MHSIGIHSAWSRAIIVGALAFTIGPVLAAAQKEWTTLENCKLIPNEANDGDSFHINANGTEYLIRLYLVDAPETSSVGPARLIEAQYFGVSVPQVIEIGEKAKLFVDAKLSQPFTVFTKKASGLGRSKIERFYAFVQTKDGDLGEQLVTNGLARIHGTHSAPPGVSSAEEEIKKLEQLEQQAKQAKLGGWAVSAGGTAAVATPKPAEQAVVGQARRPPDHPINTSPAIAPSPKPSVPIATPPREKIASAPVTPVSFAASAQSEKLDINTATKEQLEKVPGIGPRLAERIIAARPFKTADDLKKVNGFGGTKRYEEVRPFFR